MKSHGCALTLSIQADRNNSQAALKLFFSCVDVFSSKMLWELRQDAAACLGILCTVLSYEAERIFKWLFVKFNSSSRDEVKLLYLVAAQRALEAAGERKAFSHIMQVKTRPDAFHEYNSICPVHFDLSLHQHHAAIHCYSFRLQIPRPS